MDDPLLSVIVPARDAAQTLPALLDALGAQVEAGPFEVVVADDGSRDATPDLARAAGARVAHTARTPEPAGRACAGTPARRARASRCARAPPRADARPRRVTRKRP